MRVSGQGQEQVPCAVCLLAYSSAGKRQGHKCPRSRPPVLPANKHVGSNTDFSLFPFDKWKQYYKTDSLGAPGWLSRLSIQLRLRSPSHGSWVPAPRRALCWQLRVWNLLRFCVSLSLCSSPPLMLYLSVSQKWINVKKLIRTFYWGIAYTQRINE